MKWEKASTSSSSSFSINPFIKCNIFNFIRFLFLFFFFLLTLHCLSAVITYYNTAHHSPICTQKRFDKTISRDNHLSDITLAIQSVSYPLCLSALFRKIRVTEWDRQHAMQTQKKKKKKELNHEKWNMCVIISAVLLLFFPRSLHFTRELHSNTQ